MICPKCGIANADGAEACTNCGASLVEAQEAIPFDQPTMRMESDVTPAAAAAPVAAGVGQAAADYAQPRATENAFTGQAVPAPTAPQQNAYDQAAYTQQAGYNQQAGYGQPVAPGGPGAGGVYTGKGTPSLVLGILSIVFAGLIGLVLSIIAIVKGKKALELDPNDGRAKAGRITGIVGLILSILATLAIIAMFVGGALLLNDPEVQSAIEEGIEQAASDMTSSERAELESILNDTSSSAAATSAAATSSAANTPADTSFLDSLAPECLDANKNPTIYSLLELKGFQLETTLQQLGWNWNAQTGAWIGPNGAGYSVLDAQGNPMTDTAIGELDKGAVGTPAVQLLIQPGYANVDEALAATKVVNEDSVKGDDSTAMAVVYGPNMEEHLAILTVTNNEASWLIFNKEALAAGAIQELVGDVEGTTIEEVWQNVTGRAVGAA